MASIQNSRKTKMPKPLKLILLLICASLLIASCVTTTQVLAEFKNKWVGKNFDKFVTAHGMPFRKFQLNNGNIAYLWTSGSEEIRLPNTSSTTIYGNSMQTHYHGGEIYMSCEIQIITNKEGVIKQATILKDTMGEWKTSRCAEVIN